MIIVAGAGPAGLAAALVAARAGHEVTLLEAAPTIGGMAASFEVAGQRVDHGSHRLHPAMSADVQALLVPMLGTDLQVRERRGRVRIAGRWVGFPLRTADLVRGLPPAVAGRMAIDAAGAPFRTERADTYAEFVRSGLGPTVLAEFYGPYAAKLWGREPDHLAGEIARRRIATSSPRAMLGRLVRSRSARGRRFLYPRRGFGQISECLADAAVGAGVDIRLSAPLTSARSGSGEVEVTSGTITIGGSSLLSTLPLAGLLAALGEHPPPTEYRGLLLAYLVIEGRQWTPFDAHYLPGPEVIASRISEPKNYRDSVTDPPQRSVLCAEVPTSPGDEWWQAGPEVVTPRLLADLERLGLPDPVVASTAVRRVDRVYPVYGPGENPLGSAEALLHQHPNVASFGRGGRINADNTHHAIDMGIAAARSLDPDGRIDSSAWRASRARFAEHVVED